MDIASTSWAVAPTAAALRSIVPTAVLPSAAAPLHPNCTRLSADCMNSSLIGALLTTATNSPYGMASGTHLATLLTEGADDDANRVNFIAHAYVMPFLLVLGAINQCLNIATLNSLASAGYLYLKASAIADVFSIIALIPFCMRQGRIHNTHSYWTMLFHAHVELPLINSFITASALSLVAMTVERYLSIKHPITFYNTLDCRWRIRKSLIAIFVLSFLVFIPSAWQKCLVERVDPKTGEVDWMLVRNREVNQKPVFITYIVCREIVARIAPIILLTVLNLGVIKSLRRIKDRYNSRRQSSVTGRMREMDRTRISVLLLISSATFVLCTFPASVLSFFIDHIPDSFELQVFRAFANCLQVSHYLHNFYLYFICSCEYRHAFLKMIGCYKPHRLPYSNGESPTVKFSTTVLGRVCSLRFERLSKYSGRRKVPTESAVI